MSKGPIRYKPLFSLVSIVSGLLLAVSILTLLHQNGTLYPTRTMAILTLVAGFLFGIVVPSLTRLLAVRKANRRLLAR